MKPRIRRWLIPLCAQLVLLALLFQTMAFDHWRPALDDVYGIEETSYHMAHCHGDSGCSSSASVVSMALSAPISLSAPAWQEVDMPLEAPLAASFLLDSDDPPPRA